MHTFALKERRTCVLAVALPSYMHLRSRPTKPAYPIATHMTVATTF